MSEGPGVGGVAGLCAWLGPVERYRFRFARQAGASVAG